MGNKTAILGGAFDPPTLGHVAVAKHVLANGFNLVWLQPCFAHRFGKQMAEPHHRLAMCKLVIEKGMIASDYEIQKKLPGPTYYMLKSFADLAAYAGNKDYENPFLIIGSDNILCFDKWFKSEALKGMANFVVVPRKGSELPVGEQWFRKPPHVVLPPMGAEPTVESSTQVRRMVKEGKSTDGLLNPMVASYVWEHGLYRG